ncbi:hypothetical protein L873DRAFT_1791391 [Choiromyces venosus 120613-1]|uniref:Uncharacterized protein n=1 Tax=Choiromyces venosus 120613-1 TaxID=1336337 RepID=A0A3N4JIF6_9PEZI|nr:hypothetical protein L873DRAFT_1791391 [Choiromyces venosus 120613-1]
MPAIPSKYSSNSCTRENSCHVFGSTFCPNSPIPLPTPSLTTFTPSPALPIEPPVKWLPTTPRPGSIDAIFNDDVEAPFFGEAKFAPLLLAFLVGAFIELCRYLYNHIREVQNNLTTETDEDFEPRVPMPAPPLEEVDENPLDDNPADESPADESPVDESPADESSADESPVSENPPEYSGGDRAAYYQDLMRWTSRYANERFGWRSRSIRARMENGEEQEGIVLLTHSSQTFPEVGLQLDPETSAGIVEVRESSVPVRYPPGADADNEGSPSSLIDEE